MELRELLSAPLKKTPQATVRVCDQYLPIRDGQTGSTKGLIRCILYLQDLGEISGAYKTQSNQGVTRQASLGLTAGQENHNPNSGDAAQQTVWQLELWKRAEEQKFKAWLKQRELERIEEVTATWKTKEADRERTFMDSMSKVAQLEQKVRGKAIDL